MKKKLDIKFGIGLALFLVLVGGLIWWGHEKRIEDLILGADTSATFPTACSAWIACTDVLTDNGVCGAGNDANPLGTFTDFGFTFTASTIDGITVVIEAAAATKDLDSDLSWNAGTNYTAEKRTSVTGGTCGSPQVKTYGGSTDTWGRTWVDTEFSNANFIARMNKDSGTSGGSIDTDYISVTVTYTAAVTTNTATQVIIVISRLWEGLKDIHLPTFAELTAPRSFAQTSDGYNVVTKEIQPWNNN